MGAAARTWEEVWDAGPCPTRCGVLLAPTRANSAVSVSSTDTTHLNTWLGQGQHSQDFAG